MVGPLKRRKIDPNGKRRGPGLYYHRGNGEFSKYSPKRDANKKSGKRWTSKRQQTKYKHTSDGFKRKKK